MSYYNVETDDVNWARVKVEDLHPDRRAALKKLFLEEEIREARGIHGLRCEARRRQNGMSKADH